MTTMRAKFVVSNVERFETVERVTFRAVCKPEGYGDDGLDEDNTFSKFTPTADLSMCITNPALLGQFEIGQKYYSDFSPVTNGALRPPKPGTQRVAAEGFDAHKGMGEG